MTISKDRVKPSPLPDSWKLKEIFATGVVLGGYLALMTVIFFWAMYKTDFFSVSFDIFVTLVMLFSCSCILVLVESLLLLTSSYQMRPIIFPNFIILP